MSETALATNGNSNAGLMESALLHGDIEKMGPNQRVAYYMEVCRSLGLNALTKPFEFLRLNGKLQLYARKDCTEQLRKLHGVSIKIVGRELVDGVYVVTAQATDKTGRTDESIGAVPIEGLKGEAKANAVMKAETKSKRRVTLSICGLGMLDETEVDAIPGATTVAVEIPKDEPAPPPPANEFSPPDDGEPIDPADQKAITDIATKDLGWARPHSISWLRKYFGVESSMALSMEQGKTARTLLETHKDHGEDIYRAKLKDFFEMGLVRNDGAEA